MGAPVSKGCRVFMVSAALFLGTFAIQLPAYAAWGQTALVANSTDTTDVKTLQTELHRLGYQLAIDGNFGPDTTQDVERFQSTYGLTPDGVVGPATFAALHQAMLALDAKSAVQPSKYTVVSGDSLWTIAKRTGTSVDALMTLNHLTDPNELQIGQTLLLPSHSLLATTASAATQVLTFGQRVAATAEQFLGVPYVWGGNTPQGFDCSGLVQYVFSLLGVSLPRTSEEQLSVGTAVAESDLQPGDLVFFSTYSFASHVGIYIGNNKFIDALTSGAPVQIDDLSSPYFAARYVGARAVAPAS